MCVVAAIVLVGAASSAAQEPPQQTTAPAAVLQHQIHAAYLLGRQTIGSYGERSNILPTGEIQTVIESDLIFNRLGNKVEIKSTGRYEETAAGQFKSASADVSSSQQVTHIEASVVSNSLHITTTADGRSYERTVALSGALLGPEAARRLVLSHRPAPGGTITYDAFYPELGVVATVTDTVVGAEEVSTDQGRVPALKIEQTMSAMPGKVTLWLDSEGWLLRETVPGPFGDVEALRSNAPVSTNQVEGAALPEETFSQSIIKANIRLPQERFVESIRLKIIQKQPELGWPDLETENQHVIEKTRDYVILEVHRPQPKDSQKLPSANEATLAPYLSPNALLQSDDPTIQAIARKVVGDEHDAWKAARALQVWTNEHMQFDLGVAVAPASEVARNLRGTCFGYSMLLGALTRAAGIPSRLRMGFVYAGGIWGGHAWIDVRIGNDWIPLDSALYSPGPADAARFSFYTSALEDGTLTGVGALGQLYSHADVKILDYTVAGKHVAVPENAVPFVIEKDTYRNQWLGISVNKPASFAFTDSNLTWPQTTVIAMKEPGGQTAEVANLSAIALTPAFDAVQKLRSDGIQGRPCDIHIAGKSAVALCSAQKAGAILIDHGNTWKITTTGPAAAALLKRVTSTISLAH
jgi:hypothetical protein